MPLINVAVKQIDRSLWGRIQVAVIKRITAERDKTGDSTFTTAKWLTEAARVKLRKENG